MCHFFLVYTWCPFLLVPFFPVPFFPVPFFPVPFFQATNCHTYMHWRRNRGGGARGACAPHFSEWRAKICLCPPTFRPRILGYGIFSKYICYYLFMAMLDNGVLSPLRACHLWGLKKYAQESACDCQMVVTDKRFLLVPVDRPHWIFRGRIGSK